jgi:hypothetical protein
MTARIAGSIATARKSIEVAGSDREIGMLMPQSYEIVPPPAPPAVCSGGCFRLNFAPAFTALRC